MRPADRLAAIEGLDREIATYQAEDRARIPKSEAAAFTTHRIERGMAVAATAWHWPAGVMFWGGDA